MTLVVGALLIANGSVLYWWIYMLGVISLIIGVVQVMFGIAKWYKKPVN